MEEALAMKKLKVNDIDSIFSSVYTVFINYCLLLSSILISFPSRAFFILSKSSSL